MLKQNLFMWLPWYFHLLGWMSAHLKKHFGQEFYVVTT